MTAPDLIRHLRSHPFLRRVAVVVGGTAAAQAITIAVSPLITRLYGPEIFGVFGVFTAALALVTPLANLSYGAAIVLPESDDEARTLFKLAALIGLIMAILSFIVVAAFGAEIAEAIGFTADPHLLLIAPVMVMLSAVAEPLHHWLYRMKKFGVISRAAVIEAAANGLAKVGIGTMAATVPALLATSVFASALQVSLLWASARHTLMGCAAPDQSTKRTTPSPALRDVARRFRDFPLFKAPNDWLNMISNSIPPLILAAALGPVPAGFYLLARRVVVLPITVISGAIGPIFLTRFVEATHGSERLRPLLLKGTAALAAAGLVPFGIIVAFGPWLFSLVFGAGWEPAGEYARWLCLWFYFAFIAAPSFHAIPVLGLQGHFLVYQIAVLALRAGALAAGAIYFGNDVLAIALLSIVGAVVNGTQIIWCAASCDVRSRDDLAQLRQAV
ncbi:lipopolysaccharide biosynthesis protein [Microvirga subterranea]|uniref:O-antigen/teichoic acid export membrane protein n=1 Tax=Microvirga subterranea TaxID=186651 RepID=A0A370HN54_9HYPH|nr:oligosaccharide flippase family protein [Microvirga subterranea]RDI60003.1 O-antigen/teichoic acid export membrane protein [Microvirga subterranea]